MKLSTRFYPAARSSRRLSFTRPYTLHYHDSYIICIVHFMTLFNGIVYILSNGKAIVNDGLNRMHEL